VVLVMVGLTFRMVRKLGYGIVPTSLILCTTGRGRGQFRSSEIQGIIEVLLPTAKPPLTQIFRHCRATWRSSPSPSEFAPVPNQFEAQYLIHTRIFELLMAFDALRLRNIIQLIGILRPSSNVMLGIASLTPCQFSTWLSWCLPHYRYTKRGRLW
jgi:hypothetical protein